MKYLFPKMEFIIWHGERDGQCLSAGRQCARNVISQTPGITRFAASRITNDVESAFKLFITEDIFKIILEMTNKEANRVTGRDVCNMNELKAFYGLRILAGLYKSRHESLRSLWDDSYGRPIFRATMSLKNFLQISKYVRFDDKTTRNPRRRHDMLAALRDIWDKFVERHPLMFNISSTITIDEMLVPFRGRCPFR